MPDDLEIIGFVATTRVPGCVTVHADEPEENYTVEVRASNDRAACQR